MTSRLALLLSKEEIETLIRLIEIEILNRGSHWPEERLSHLNSILSELQLLNRA